MFFPLQDTSLLTRITKYSADQMVCSDTLILSFYYQTYPAKRYVHVS